MTQVGASARTPSRGSTPRAHKFREPLNVVPKESCQAQLIVGLPGVTQTPPIALGETDHITIRHDDLAHGHIVAERQVLAEDAKRVLRRWTLTARSHLGARSRGGAAISVGGRTLTSA